MVKEIIQPANPGELLYSEVQKLRKDYKNAFISMPSFGEACAGVVFDGYEINTISFAENGTRFQIESHASTTHDVLRISTVDPDFNTDILLYSNTSALNGKGDTNGNMVFKRECIRPSRNNELETQEMQVEGETAIKHISDHLEEMQWIVLQDFAAK